MQFNKTFYFDCITHQLQVIGISFLASLQSHSDHMDLVSRRMGFIPLPLAVVLIRVVSQSLEVSFSLAHVSYALATCFM